MSIVLIKEEDKVSKQEYYVSKVLLEAETRYLWVKKLAYPLIIAVRKFCPYFQAHPFIVLTDQPIKHILQRLDTLGCLLKWSIAHQISTKNGDQSPNVG